MHKMMAMTSNESAAATRAPRPELRWLSTISIAPHAAGE
jgi:hypothetical protein